MNINWYPGHMKKTADEMRELLKRVDLCCEIIDARIPMASSNPMLNDMLEGKPKLVILNKVDMADPNENKRWVEYLTKQGSIAMPFNAIQDKKTGEIYQNAKKLVKDLFERRANKQIENREIRMMVYGIPNSGKSTFINNLSKRRGAKVGNRPGVTTTKQWIKTDQDLVLLDTPGVLWPKFAERTALHLAYTGAIKDEVMEIQEVGFLLIKELLASEPNALYERYGVEERADALRCMEEIAVKVGALQRNREIDYTRCAQVVLEDFRKQRLGRITLEKAPR